MILKFKNSVEKNDLLLKSDKVLLAISGGIDSVVLLHIFVDQQYNVEAAHCNFKLREDESDEDEQFVINFCKNLGVKLYRKTFDTKHYASINKLSIEMAARELRYAWFHELIEEFQFDKLAIAHHLDDNLETLFINLLRGSGLHGLKGIPVKNGKIVRPLLGVSRDEIVEYAKANSLRFCNDSSNKSTKYLRNKIRHRLIPVLKNINKDSDKVLANSMEFLADDNDIFRRLLDEKRNELFDIKDDLVYIPYSKLKELKPVKSWIYRLLSIFNFGRSVCDNISDTIFIPQSGKTFFSETHRLVNDRDCLIINRISPNEEDKEFLVSKDVNRISNPINLIFETLRNDENFKVFKDDNTAYFDFDKLSFPLVLRRWHKKDRFKPFGMNGTKLLSDFFIDKKLSLHHKENAWVLTSGEKIIWIVGMRAANTYRVVASTNNILKVKLFQKM